MGFFDWFKRKKCKTWQLPDHSDNLLVTAVSRSLAKITLGDKLVVKKDWMVVLVAKDKALDIFAEGEHTLNLGLMPHATKLLKLDVGRKRKRRGNIVVELPKDFLCDIYFINLKVFENRLWRTDSIKFKQQKQVTKFWMQGRYDVQVRNAHDVIELFLIDWGFIRSDMALGKIDFLVSEFLSEEIAKVKGMTPDEIAKKDTFENLFKPKLEKKFEKYGLKFFNIGVESVVYPRNVEVAPIPSNTEDKFENDDKQSPSAVLAIGEFTAEEQETKTEDDVEGKEKELVTVGASKAEAEEGAEKIAEEKEDKKSSILDIEAEKPQLSERRRKTIRTCPKCGEILKAKSNVCEKCGAGVELEAEENADKGKIICPECGKENKPGTIFCKCGCYLPPNDL